MAKSKAQLKQQQILKKVEEQKKKKLMAKGDDDEDEDDDDDDEEEDDAEVDEDDDDGDLDDDDDDDDDEEEGDDDDDDDDDEEADSKGKLVKTQAKPQQQAATPNQGQKRKAEENGDQPEPKRFNRLEEDLKTLFVSGLPSDISEDDVKEISSDIISVRFPQNRSKGIAFLAFESEDIAVKNHSSLKGKKVAGNEINVDFVGAKRQQGGPDSPSLNIREIPSGTTVEDIKREFPKASNVVLREGFAILDFSSKEDSDAVFEEANSKTLNGKTVVVGRHAGGRGGGGRGGGGFGGGGGFRGGRGSYGGSPRGGGGGRGGGFRGGRGGGGFRGGDRGGRSRGGRGGGGRGFRGSRGGRGGWE